MSASLAREARRLPLTGSAFVRTLAALDGLRAPAAPDAFAQRLAGWLVWTDAFKLSAALGDASERPGAPGVGGAAALAADERELARVRAALGKTIAEAAAITAAADFAEVRRRYARCQLAMETRVVPLRRRLRASLAERSPALARLAELDTVMEQVIGARERTLLASVAARLEPRFDALRGASGEGEGEAAPGPWLAAFQREMRELLLAELDLRLQPVAGLLDACRPPPAIRP